MNTITTLPPQTEVDEFLLHYFYENMDKGIYLTDITEAVCQFFDVSKEDAELKCEFAHGQTSSDTTRIEQFAHWGCIHLQTKKFVKRVGPNEWQHISGNRPVYNINRISTKEVNRAMVSVKILHELNKTPEEIACKISHLWDADVIALAIKKVFTV